MFLFVIVEKIGATAKEYKTRIKKLKNNYLLKFFNLCFFNTCILMNDKMFKRKNIFTVVLKMFDCLFFSCL